MSEPIPQLIEPGSDLDKIKQRFQNDVMFARIVFTFMQGMNRKVYSAQDLIDAAIFAEFSNAIRNLGDL